MDRSTALEGRMNIYVALKESVTDVTVNTRYILTLTTSGIFASENIFGQAGPSEMIPRSSSTISFNTNQPNKSQDGISCFSKGVLETEILEMAIST